ncbi:NADP-dependent oxidoreductase [Pararhizobium mangrovi]|uniref:NADP-dependent oxidoreductase n=1 Tax=Pararhizobium mangrovi TaxID=2590452 RepID=A0A506UBA1_9HYPH|nr:NADP-dependent oxidoreductase [Pararhizobium mangrovi]TPW30195.1 NADP-dependent oxidoreductase [Pararhizobium mangrovi]
MKAIRYHAHGDPEVLALEEVEAPEIGPGEVLVAIRAASISPFDCKLRAGDLAAFFTVSFPQIPGRDAAGVVAAVGDGVSEFTVGDRVCVMAGIERGGSAVDLRVSTPDELVRMPAELGFVEAAGLVNAGLSAWICTIEYAEIGPGTRVLVHGGSGAVGGLIVQLARRRGADIVATCREGNRAYVEGLGADRAIAYDTEDFTTIEPVDVVFDLVGGQTHARSYSVLKKGGTLVWLVAAPITDRGDEFGVDVRRAMIADRREPVENILALAASGELRAQIAGTLPLEKAADGHAMLEAGRVTRGRLVLTLDEDATTDG